MEVKGRVEMLYGVVLAQQQQQERNRNKEVDLELPWRMVSFIEGVVLGLYDPSGELAVTVTAVQERFEEIKRLIKGLLACRRNFFFFFFFVFLFADLERINNRIRRERESPQVLQRSSDRVLSVAPRSSDPKQHFALLEQHQANMNRAEFERRRRNSIHRKNLEQASSEQSEDSLKSPMVSVEAVEPPFSPGRKPGLTSSNSMTNLDGKKESVRARKVFFWAFVKFDFVQGIQNGKSSAIRFNREIGGQGTGCVGECRHIPHGHSSKLVVYELAHG